MHTKGIRPGVIDFTLRTITKMVTLLRCNLADTTIHAVGGEKVVSHAVTKCEMLSSMGETPPADNAEGTLF